MTTNMPLYKTRSQPLAGPKRKRADTSSTTEPIAPSNKRQCLTNTLCLPSDDDARVLSAVDARYEVQLQSVISASKIQQRVTAMLRHLTPPPQSPSIQPTSNITTAKAKVSILRAKASDASKLVSIAEIVKREIEKERSTSNDGAGGAYQGSKPGRWFQYITLGEEMQWRRREVGNSVIEDTVLGGPGVNEEGLDDGDEFEIMKTPFERAVQGQPLVRGVPVMSLFLSRSSIDELKRQYGEQTNAPRS